MAFMTHEARAGALARIGTASASDISNGMLAGGSSCVLDALNTHKSKVLPYTADNIRCTHTNGQLS